MTATALEAAIDRAVRSTPDGTGETERVRIIMGQVHAVWPEILREAARVELNPVTEPKPTFERHPHRASDRRRGARA